MRQGHASGICSARPQPVCQLYQELHVVPPLAQRSGPLQVEGAFGHSLEITCGRCGAAAMSVIPECLAEVLKIFSDSFDQLGGVAQRAPTEPREQDGGGRVERVRTRRTGPSEMMKSRMKFPATPNTRFVDARGDMKP